MSAKAKGPVKLSANFTLAEARCNCGCRYLMDAASRPVLINTAAMLERVRTALGGKPVLVNSWVRCAKWNKQVGGVTDSQHLRGYAVDFTCRDLSPAEVRRRLVAAGLDDLGVGGLGVYPGFVHVDRGPRREWAG